ncbi:MAG: isoleucine--tRNA ligase [Candidatus Eremiobacteraeota bacterium]|nr:isoleucine--tRNA ligase [Candidatus Eremiobacteraeota bacterium]
MSAPKGERDYRGTLNLPQTAFPMRADLPKREPARVKWWQEHDTYHRRLARNSDNAPWILHDGPPYANGELHMGHFLNMVLKDIFVKIALLEGRWAKFVPGWDMHGLPIELETLRHLAIEDFHEIDPIELRARCKERALHWLGVQRTSRMRMGCFGEFGDPYRTIDPEYEATIVDALGDLAAQHQIYKGLRSTLWCIHDETALAEAEIEYAMRVSPSIYVRFPTNAQQSKELLNRFGNPKVDQKPLSVLIWTTTPWTLPGNAAIALRPEAQYALFDRGSELVVAAVSRLGEVRSQFGGAELRALATRSGADLDGAVVRHPLADRDSQIVLADYVDLETGTGAVHTAPGHGADDFETGLKYNLPMIMPVDARGHFTAEAGEYAGMQVFEANARIISDLRERGALVSAQEYTHSYPHCWRCHNPVIFRATLQWFIAMDQNRLRARTLSAVPDVGWTPAWGQARITQMIENHPEWCISRQRMWGTPIPAVVCLECGESILSPDVARLAAERFRAVGADAWYRDDVATFLPSGFTCPHCKSSGFEKEKNIVDIWFESGVTHLAVLGRNGMPWPSDVVVEGGDQYRGWFRSSLVTAIAIKHAPPYKHVIKNGWVNDAEGHAMSKSLGNYVAADEAMAKYGADVLRLWSASVEYVDDVRFGDALIEQVGRVYRNIRYRVRFLLSVLDDFRPEMTVPRNRMYPFDRAACCVADEWYERVREQYGAFNLHDAYLSILTFEGEDLSSFYLDALKDPLYTELPDSSRRRSAQSALWYILGLLLRVLAPLLPFTAEEAWQFVPAALRDDTDSVFDLEPPKISTPDEDMLNVWRAVRALRAQVAAGDGVRDYEASAVIEADGAMFDRLQEYGEGLREALVVSALELKKVEGFDGARLATLQPADGGKCVRCWKVLPLGTDAGHPALCARCAGIVRELEKTR